MHGIRELRQSSVGRQALERKMCRKGIENPPRTGRWEGSRPFPNERPWVLKRSRLLQVSLFWDHNAIVSVSNRFICAYLYHQKGWGLTLLTQLLLPPHPQPQLHGYKLTLPDLIKRIPFGLWFRRESLLGEGSVMVGSFLRKRKPASDILPLARLRLLMSPCLPKQCHQLQVNV